MSIEEYLAALSTPGAAEALSALCALAKGKKEREQINLLLGDRQSLYGCAVSPEAKTRKNAYRLMGALENKADGPVLREALQKETTLFSIPSILLSLGSLGEKEAIEAYEPPASQSEGMDKHVAEIALAREKALSTFAEKPVEKIYLLPEPRKILCCSPEGFEGCLAEELKELGFAPVLENGAVYMITDKIGRLYKAECMSEALLIVAKDVDLTPAALAKAAGELPGQAYRIELRGYMKDRRKLIGGLTALLPGHNNPSAYDCELRVECREDKADLFYKLYNVGDSRYPWRKKALPASLHPATAACIARYAKAFEKAQRPRVLDPFCGSGSLLFSRENLGSCRALIGVDKSGSAVESARENAQAGKSKASFITKDILRFEAREGFDLILTNMPFGNRVGSHENNLELYSRFVSKLPYLLNKDGVAVLYTMEYRLLESCLKKAKGIRLLERRRTEAGGLLPWIFVVDKG